MDYREEIQRALGSGFAIERELPGAGTSSVYVAEELALGRRVVIKMLSSKSSGGVNVQRFEREIAVAARLQHPHLVPLLTAGVVSSAGVPWFSMPFVEGESLRELIVRRGPLPMGQAVRLLREIASALAYAHTRGIVHRDIKPENVLLSDGVAMITDFGVAMAVDSAIAAGTKGGRRLTGAGTTLGTPAYSAPEQIGSAGSVDHRADIYAYGCMAYEILTGAPPFANHSLRELLVAQISEQPDPVTQHRPNVPPAIARMVMLCLQKSPDERPQSASEIVNVIDGITLTSIHESGETPAAPTARLEAATVSTSAVPTPARAARVPLLTLILAVTFILMVVVLFLR